ncbi:MAG: hypothetical protein AAGI30_01985 [Planctomycetota bacterium]
MNHVATVIGALAVAGAATAQIELLPDPAIEIGSGAASAPPGATEWGFFGAAGINAFFGDNGHLSFFADNPSNSGGAFHQGIGGSAGFEYTFTLVDVFVEPRFNADLQIALEFYAGDDSTQLGVETLIIDTDDDTTPIGFSGGPFASVSAIAPVGTVFVRPVIQFSNPAPLSGGGGPNFFVFAASLVPSPAVAPAMLCMALGVRRRR